MPPQTTSPHQQAVSQAFQSEPKRLRAYLFFFSCANKALRAHAHTVSPLHVHFVALRAVLPQTRIHIHEQLLHVEGQPVDSAVPVFGRVRFERGVQDRQNHIAALRNERHYFFLKKIMS